MKKKRISLLITLAAALTIAGLWYFWPRSLWDILPYYTQPEEAFTSCSAILSPFDPGDGLPIQTVEFPLDSPPYDQLKELLDSSSYRRGLSDLFRLGRASDTQVVTLSPYAVSIYFRRGELQWSIDFWGPRAVANSSTGASRTYHPTGGTTFQQEVVDFIASHAPKPTVM